MTKRLLITGAAGFLGRHTARAFSQSGWEVAGLGYADAAFDPQDWGVSHWQESAVSVDSLELLSEQAGVADVVLHAAGGSAVGKSWDDTVADFNNTVTTTAAVVEWMRKYAPKALLLYPSSAALYGEASAEACEENAPLQPMSPYGIHKLLAEQLCSSAARLYRLDVAIVRYFSLYGPGLNKQLLWDVSKKLESCGDTLTLDGTGKELRDFFYIDDAVGLLKHLVEMPSPKRPLLVNGATGVATSVEAVVRLLADALGYEDTTVRFTGNCRAGNPNCLVGSIKQLQNIGFSAETFVGQGIKHFAQHITKVHA